jgi:hypothetical protein
MTTDEQGNPNYWEARLSGDKRDHVLATLHDIAQDVDRTNSDPHVYHVSYQNRYSSETNAVLHDFQKRPEIIQHNNVTLHPRSDGVYEGKLMQPNILFIRLNPDIQPSPLDRLNPDYASKRTKSGKLAPRATRQNYFEMTYFKPMESLLMQVGCDYELGLSMIPNAVSELPDSAILRIAVPSADERGCLLLEKIEKTISTFTPEVQSTSVRLR